MKSWILIVYVFRFGKHRKDERLGEKIDRKGSSKWRPEETQVSDEETMKMRMEQERWGNLWSPILTTGGY